MPSRVFADAPINRVDDVMTNKRFTVFIVVAVPLLALALVGLGFWLEGPSCIRNRDSRVIGGRISSVGGLFASETAYYLRYTGNKEGTEEECTFLKRTTAAEYNRRMFGKETDAPASP